MQACKDGSGKLSIKFDFMTGGQEIKIAIRVEFHFFSRYFVSFVNISMLIHHFWRFF